MRIIKNSRSSCRIYYFLIGITIFSLFWATPLAQATDGEELFKGCESFEQVLKKNDDTKSLAVGDKVLHELQQRYRGNAGFSTYMSKLAAAEFLARQMVSHLKRATRQQIFVVADELFAQPDQKRKPLAIPPAKQFCDTSITIFSNPIRIDGLADIEKRFLAHYYNLKLRTFTSMIAKAGQALAIAEPRFRDAHNYVLVLPLLHTTARQAINIEVLPPWMRKHEQLRVFSDACLLHYGLPFQAMMLAKNSSEMRNAKFSELDFYKSAARRCGPSQANTAVECLEKAIESLSDTQPNTVIALQFDIVQQWWDAGNFTLAAGQAKKIYETYPNCKDYGKAVNLYYYALSRNNNANAILTDIDTAIKDMRCADYQAKLMYIKWWALRRDRKQGARIAAVEHELLRLYNNNPMIAPIMLSRSTDLLAQQDYVGAQQLLDQLMEKFPTSRAAKQARKMLDKLQMKQNK